ncbi:MAG: TonB-dependent receptor [Comamonadaceae bacterium]|uniref:TonB-dependent receptor n=1 Tax=Hydrogenophaga borbori TaxID=2294117 RepID=A0A372EDR8_9BURK|nr:TonB-dependent receptor [Hydrogenophaga borbori]NCT96178.1 TonB-dependent receptor [Comamonadaceae bacterium]RFP75565.1 TonB-dependent receptor [Hydrogenophaga borbori]
MYANGGWQLGERVQTRVYHTRIDNDQQLPGALTRQQWLDDPRHASGFFFGPTLDIVGKRWADFSNTYRVDGYTLWGLRAGWTGKDWEVFAEARNLADKNHVSYFSVRDRAGTNDAILQSGEPRSFYVGARLRF